MALFSPYDIERIYGKAFGDVAISELLRTSWLPTIAFAKIHQRLAISSSGLPKFSLKSGLPVYHV